jgi:hypothetical protein
VAGRSIIAGTYWFRRILFVSLLGVPASAQIDELLPEVDVHYKTARDVRVSFQAKQTREGGDPTQVEIGPSIAFYLKPLVKLKNVAAFDLNDAKSRPLEFSIGYRFGKHLEFDPYYEHQDNTGKSPNQQLNQFGLVLSVYF